MIRSVLVFLLIFSGIAWADEKEDQKNVYDFFSMVSVFASEQRGQVMVD